MRAPRRATGYRARRDAFDESVEPLGRQVVSHLGRGVGLGIAPQELGDAQHERAAATFLRRVLVVSPDRQ
jgi:hypothetical protein